MMRRTRSSAGASTATVQAHSRSRPLSTRLMASSPTRDCARPPAHQLRRQVFVHDGVEPLQGGGVGKHDVPQLLPVQGPVGAEHRAEGPFDGPPQGGVCAEHLVIHGVAVQHRAAQVLQGRQSAGFSRAGAAGEADENGRSASTRWKPAAFFRRLATARPRPPSSGHWAKISVTSVPSKVRRASNTCRAWADLSAAGPRRWMMCPAYSGAYSSKQMTPAWSDSRPRMRRALRSGAPVTTVTGAWGA